MTRGRIPDGVILSREQQRRIIDLTRSGLNRRDAEMLVYLWDGISLEDRLEMFELAGNEEEAEIVRQALKRESDAL